MARDLVREYISYLRVEKGLAKNSLSAIKKNEYLKKYYEQVKMRRGHGKAKIALARKYLGIIYSTLTNNWVFEDFNNFVLAE